MGRVGIRELKQNASAVIAAVKAGETMTVTDRGRPVARLSPLRLSRLEQLEEEGLVRRAKRSIADLPAPSAPPPSARETLTDALLRMRDEDRE